MNEIEKEQFHKRINSIPYWVKSKEDMAKYCRHINFRLVEKTAHLNSLYSYLEIYHPEVAKEIGNISGDWELIERTSVEMEREYDGKYNFNQDDLPGFDFEDKKDWEK